MHNTSVASQDLTKQVLIGIGTLGLISGVWMAFSFGKTMTFAHGVTLGLLAVLVAFMPARIDYLNQLGRKWLVRVLTGLCAVFMVAEYGSHLGYTIGNRVESNEQTAFHNQVKLATAKAQSNDQAAEVSRWKDRQSHLNAERAQIVKTNSWVVNLEPGALQTKLEAAQLAERLEAGRGGCKTICEQRKRDVSVVEQQIATLNRVHAIQDEVKGLDAKIAEAQQASVAKADAVVATGYKSSPIVAQTKFVGQLWTSMLEPDEASLTWTQIAIGAIIALVTTFLAPISFLLAFSDQGQQMPKTNAKLSVPLEDHFIKPPYRQQIEQAAPAYAMAPAPAAMAAMAAAPPVATTQHITVVDGGGSLVDEITKLCRAHTDQMMPTRKAA